jgi:hypothetical protein
LKRMVIVTNDEEGTVPLENGKQIEVIPAWILSPIKLGQNRPKQTLNQCA